MYELESQQVQALSAHAFPVVNTEEEAGLASEYLAQVTKLRKALEGKHKELKKPFDDGLKQLKGEFDKLLTPLAQAEQHTRQALLTYNERVESLREAHRLAEQARYTQSVQAAVEAGQPVEDVPVPLPPDGPVGKGFATAHGTVTTRRIPDFEVVDESQVPLYIVHKGKRVDLWTLNTANIRKVRLDAGDKSSTIPGIAFTYKEGLQVR